MRWPLRRAESPPPDAVARLDPDERVVAWGTAADGSAVIATPLGLWLPALERLSWHHITHLSWSGTMMSVTAAVEVEPSVLENQPARSVRLTEPRTLPETVQQRFYSSRSHTTRHRLSDGSGVIIVARRVPGQDGLTWYAVYDDVERRNDPIAQAEVEWLLDSARSP